MTDIREYRNALGQFPTGVTVITANDTKGEPVGMTANSFSSVSLDPMLVLWSIAKTAGAFEAFIQAKHFAIHVLNDSQQQASESFASTESNRFATLDFTTNDNGVPLLSQFSARFECTLEQQYAGGDHVIIVGRVHNFEYTDQKPLAFQGGEYGRFQRLD